MAWRLTVRVLVIVSVGGLLASCGILAEPRVTLLTDRPEIASYVERYNAFQDTYKVEVEYRESPAQAVQDGEAGDIAIGEWLSTPQLLARFDSTSDIVKPGKVDPSSFYPGLLSMGSNDNRPTLIPLSFDLPAIVFYKPSVSQEELPAMFMPVEILKSLSHPFNATSKDGFPSAMGFSPRWNPEFLTQMGLVLGARIRAGRAGLPTWDSDGLQRTVDLVKSWMSDVNGGAEPDRAFADRYLVQPYFKLLASQRIRFALTSFSDFMQLPEERRKDLDFRWLSSGGTIPVRDNVLFAGILRGAHNKRGAKAFLEWFCALRNQSALLDSAQSLRLGVFGITNGFSAYTSVNEKEFSTRYPILLGHVPVPSTLRVPETLPDDWQKVRQEVIDPWLLQTAAGQEDQDLTTRVDEWKAAATRK